VLPSPISQPVSPSTAGAILLFEPPGLVNFRPSAPSSVGQNPPSGFVRPFRGGARLLLHCRVPRQPVLAIRPTDHHIPGDLFNLSGPSAHFWTVPMNRPSRGGAASTSSPRYVSTDFVNPSFRPARASPAPMCRERRAEGAGSVPPRHLPVKSFLIRRGDQDRHTVHGAHRGQPHNL
jgi:hypothetical protein